MDLTDAGLLEGWRARRDAVAFNELVTRHAGMVYATSARILRNDADAEDVTQECFLRLSEADLTIRVSLGAWLHRLATNRSINLLREQSRRQRREHLSSAAMNSARSEEPSWSQLREHVDEAIEALPEDLREVIVSHFLERETHDTIARRLGISSRQVAYRIEKGIDAIRGHLRREGLFVGVPVLAAFLAEGLAIGAPSALLADLAKVALAGKVGKEGGSQESVSASRRSPTADRARRLATPGTPVVATPKLKALVPAVASLMLVGGAVVLFYSWPPPRPEAPRSLTEREKPGEPAIASHVSQEPVEGEKGVAGRVLDAKTGEPLGGARIRGGDTETVAGDDGRFLLRGLLHGTHALTASRDGYSEKELRVTLGQGEEKELDILLEALLAGIVTDVSGHPVPDAEVALVERRYRPGTGFFVGVKLVETTRADEQGEFRLTAPHDDLLRDPAKRDAVFVRATAPGYAYSTVSFTDPVRYVQPFYDHVRVGPRDDLCLVLVPEIEVDGRVVSHLRSVYRISVAHQRVEASGRPGRSVGIVRPLLDQGRSKGFHARDRTAWGTVHRGRAPTALRWLSTGRRLPSRALP